MAEAEAPARPADPNPIPALDPDTASSAKATSRADWKRSSGRFSRQRLTICWRPDGTPPLTPVSSEGSSLRIARIVSIPESRANARRPESIS